MTKEGRWSRDFGRCLPSPWQLRSQQSQRKRWKIKEKKKKNIFIYSAFHAYIVTSSSNKHQRDPCCLHYMLHHSYVIVQPSVLIQLLPIVSMHRSVPLSHRLKVDYKVHSATLSKASLTPTPPPPFASFLYNIFFNTSLSLFYCIT